VADDRIDETRYCHAVDQIAHKPRTANHRAGSNRRTRVGKSKLEDPDRKKRDASRFISCRGVFQEEPVVADEPVAMAEHECEAPGVKKNAAKTRVYDAFHQDVHRFARPAEPGLQHRESDLHAEDEEGCDQCPDCVYRVNNVIALQRWFGSLGQSAEAEKTWVDEHDSQQHQRQSR